MSNILETKIGNHTVTANKWPFTLLLLRQRKLVQLFGESFNPIITAMGVEEEQNDEDLKAIVTAVLEVMNIMDEETLTWFQNTILSGVLLDGKDMGDVELRDVALAGSTGLFIEICIFVIKGNCADFLELLKTRLGFDLSSVLQNSKEDVKNLKLPS